MNLFIGAAGAGGGGQHRAPYLDALTSEEFERIVTDYGKFGEEGVSEKMELAETSTHSQSQHSAAFNTGATVSGSYWGSYNFSYGWI